jgi:crotonobetainyl-CoA:carnitine CoA-transferase CaiB-like acyl-CoA transferase
VLSLVDKADVLVEGLRPGVMERLGPGSDAVAARNPRIVYARVTGWGQTGPLSASAGHDINYISITGALHNIGSTGGPPVPPLNLVGDFGGGSLCLVTGILAALHERNASGRGQVVDAAITDGVIPLMSHFRAASLRGAFREQTAEQPLSLCGARRLRRDRNGNAACPCPALLEDAVGNPGAASLPQRQAHRKSPLHGLGTDECRLPIAAQLTRHRTAPGTSASCA